MSGYRHAEYVRSLHRLGRPLRLPSCVGWLLERPIRDTPLTDAIGAYPLFDCEDWSALGADLAALEGRLVSVCVVPDPLASAATLSCLGAAFPDLARPFKTHYVRALSLPVTPSPHHRRNVRRALQLLSVERCAEPATHLAEWESLYRNLSTRHDLERSAVYFGDDFETQLKVPGIEMFAARRNDTVVGMTLWYVVDDRVHYHLGAYSDVGYDCGASFALFQVALEHFKSSGVQWAALGGAPGLADDRGAGLARFKKGWATGERSAFLCGRILDHVAYARLSDEHGATGFFPAYRGSIEASAS